jgi:hypothetical protein
MKSINNNDPIEPKATTNGLPTIALFAEAAEAEDFAVKFAGMLCAAVVAAILVVATIMVEALVVESCLFKVVLIN